MRIAAWLLSFTLTTAPFFGSSPQDIHLRIILDHEERHRWLIVELVGDEYRRSDVELHGDAPPPRTFERWIKAVPCGHYHVVATVVDDQGKREVRQSPEIIISGAYCD